MQHFIDWPYRTTVGTGLPTYFTIRHKHSGEQHPVRICHYSSYVLTLSESNAGGAWEPLMKSFHILDLLNDWQVATDV